MRIFSSVVYRLPFIVWVLFRPQTNSSTGSKKRSHVSWGCFLPRLPYNLYVTGGDISFHLAYLSLPGAAIVHPVE
jgi:hypothetical protein